MDNCPFYKIKTISLQSREISRHQQQETQQIKAPWCSHKHSPVFFLLATTTAGGANLLKCGGEINRCQIPKDKTADL